MLIQINPETSKKLKKIKIYNRETYDEIINRLIIEVKNEKN